MSTEKQMADHFRKLKLRVLIEAFSPIPVINLLFGPIAAGGGLLILRSSALAGEAPDWVFSQALTYTVIALSCVSILLGATKSLFPALVLLIASFVAIAIGSPAAICTALMVLTLLCAMAFHVGHNLF